jgi:hypothetical protein
LLADVHVFESKGIRESHPATAEKLMVNDARRSIDLKAEVFMRLL